MALAYSYVRFSTPEQMKGDSLRRQNSHYENLCAKHNLTPATQYFDAGASAFKGKKQRELDEFLALVRAGKIEAGSWLVIESFDRISRKGFWTTAGIVQEIVNSGINVATIKPERILDEKVLNEPMAIMELLMIASRANEESSIKSDRVKNAWHAKLSRANDEIVTARGASWLKLVNGKWEPIAERVEVIKQIFKWTISGLGQRAIAKRLNEQKVKTFGKGKKWGWAFVRLITTDRRVIGEFKTKEGIIKEYYPRVIDEKIFLKAQALTKQRQRFRGNTTQRISNLFSGLAFDAGTNTTMVYVKKASDKPARFTPSFYELQKVRGAVSFPYELFEEKFLQIMGELTLADIGRAEKASNEQADELEIEIAALDDRLDQLKTQMMDLDQSPDGLVALFADLTQRRKTLANDLEGIRAENELGAPSDALASSKEILAALRDATGEELVEMRLRLRQSIRQLVKKITCKLTKKGWHTSIDAQIEFHSGHQRRLFLVVKRGEFKAMFCDLNKWKDKKPDGMIEVGKAFPEFAQILKQYPKALREKYGVAEVV